MTDFLNRADECKKKFKLREAADLYEQHLKNAPNDVRALANLGVCYMLLTEYNLAFDKFSLVLNYGCDDIVSVYKEVLAVILQKPFDFSKVKTKWETPSYFMDVLEAVVDRKDYDLGLKLFEVFMAEVNNAEWFNDADNQYRVIMLIVELGDTSTAEALCSNLLKRTEFSWQGYAASARILEAKGDIGAAKKAYDIANNHGGEGDERFESDVKKAKYRMLNNGSWTPKL